MNSFQDKLSIREFLLTEALRFVGDVRRLSGVRRIAVIGSILTDKPDPKDIDMHITVGVECDLTPLAAAGRRLKGRAQSRNSGADIFLADEEGRYIGRTCRWRDCRPGIRVACEAGHCGARRFLYDDLHIITLSPEYVLTPGLELWPFVLRRKTLPRDVEAILAEPLGGPALKPPRDEA